MKKLSNKTIKDLSNAIADHDFDEFEEIVSKLTPNQLVDYSNRTDCHKDFAYVLWTVSVSWGFEHGWATLKRMTPEEIEKLKVEHPGIDTEVPDNLTPDIPFSKHGKWAPQDNFHRLHR